VQEGFAELTEHLGDRASPVELPDIFRNAVEWHQIIMETDIALSFEREYRAGADKLSNNLRQMIERGRGYRAVDYNHAAAQIPLLRNALGDICEEYDAVITPAATGEAPVGLESTGSPIFCTLWTLCGCPAITLPILQGSSGMPIGVQLTSCKGDDARLLRNARWLTEAVEP
jgi:Asp-tRNA(Asn)/Glu-tRNA(Gln) amidotransferase A subunit family amidase